MAEREAMIPPKASEFLDPKYLAQIHVKQSSWLLMFACLLGIIGMIAAVLVTPGTWYLPTSHADTLNMYGKPFPSGKPLLYDSISSMIHDEKSPAGKIFYACLQTGTISMFMSGYPYVFENVYSNAPAFICKCPLTMNALRAYVVPIGLFLVWNAPVNQVNLKDPGQQTAGTFFHTTGAVIALASTIWAELYYLAVHQKSNISGVERVLRWICVICALLGAVVYQASPMFYSFGCCPDVYLPVNETVMEAAKHKRAYAVAAADGYLIQLQMEHPEVPVEDTLYNGLYDTASGLVFHLKIATFWGETTALVSVMAGCWVIWYFGEARHIHTNLEEDVAKDV